MNTRLRLLLTLALVLLVSAQRLPAPIQEVQESPTPAPEQSAKPKAKRPKVTSENSKSSTKQQTTSPLPKIQVTPQRNPFDGAWSGIMNSGILGDAEMTFVISAAGTALIEKSKYGTFTYHPATDGKTMKWQGRGFISWTLTPNPDGKTALVTADRPFIGYRSAVFHKTSP